MKKVAQHCLRCRAGNSAIPHVNSNVSRRKLSSSPTILSTPYVRPGLLSRPGARDPTGPPKASHSEKGESLYPPRDARPSSRRAVPRQQSDQIGVARQSEEPRSGGISFPPIGSASSPSKDSYGSTAPFELANAYPSRPLEPGRPQSQHHHQLRQLSPAQTPGIRLPRAAPRSPAPLPRVSESYNPRMPASTSRPQLPIASPPIPDLSHLPPKRNKNRAVSPQSHLSPHTNQAR